jgi:hypothetical protein
MPVLEVAVTFAGQWALWRVDGPVELCAHAAPVIGVWPYGDQSNEK